jgi:hypothetical protein
MGFRPIIAMQLCVVDLPCIVCVFTLEMKASAMNLIKIDAVISKFLQPQATVGAWVLCQQPG